MIKDMDASFDFFELRGIIFSVVPDTGSH